MPWTEGAIPAVSYNGPPLREATCYSWRVCGTADGREVFSEATFETRPAPLTTVASWIGLPVTESVEEPTRVQYLRRTFTLEEKPRRARVYASARGWYGLSLNGVDVTGVRIAPRFTAYDRRLEYEGYDVTDHVDAGPNIVGIEVAEGRYRGRNGAQAQRMTYGQQIAAIAVLYVEYASGRTELIPTDEMWEGGYGPRIFADPQAGATVDLRIPAGGFTTGAPLEEPRPVTVFPPDGVEVEPARAEPVIGVQTVKPVRIDTVEDRVIVDFGQNVVGVARLLVAGTAGTVVTVHHSELLAENGRIRTDYLGGEGTIPTIPAVDRFILAGGQGETLEPRYTLRGFRYIEIEGVIRTSLQSVEAVVIHADLEYRGEFHCSHEGLNRLHDNVVWSMRGNFTDVPTDCPTRERSGWTGDAQVFAPASVYLADVRLFLEDWLRDVGLQQAENGMVGDIVPRDAIAIPEADRILPGAGSAGWADAITIIPWTLYERYGNPTVLEQNWDAMVKWVEFCRRRAAENRNPTRTGIPRPHERFVVDTGFHWGEWLEPGAEMALEVGDADSDLPPALQVLMKLANNPDAEVATAYFAYSADLLARSAEVLEKDIEADAYGHLAAMIRHAYQAEFLDNAGFPLSPTQAKHVRPLMFGLIPEAARQGVADRLATLVRENRTRLGTGFLSTGYLLPVLSAHGHDELAVELLLQTESPSWLGQVNLGATTILESWTGAGSQNHYALGAVARWMYERLAGLSGRAPGWREIEIRPLLTDRLAHVAASTPTAFGPVACAWRRSADHWDIDVKIPAGVTARLVLPAGMTLTDRTQRVSLPSGDSVWRAERAAEVVADSI